MKPPPFEYVAPDSLEEALAIRADAGRAVVVLAGGQSLIPALNLRISQPEVVLDLNGIPGLDGIEEQDGELVIGALARQRSVERSPLVGSRFAVLPEALAHVAHPAIRNRGTIGGSLAYADPSGEIPAVAAALDATLLLRSATGERVVAARDFALGPYMTVIAQDEILVEIRIPASRAGTAFLEVSRRHGDSALAGVAASVTVTDGVVTEARLALLGAGPAAVRADDAEAALVGAPAGAAAFDTAAASAADALETYSDHHGSAAYRRHLARVLAARALALAASRSRA